MHSKLKSESISGDLNFENATGIHIRRDFDAKLKEIEEEVLLTIADASLDDYLELYDVGLNLIMGARSILEKQLSTSNDHLPYLIIISKITTLMVALRKMIHSGLPDAFKCIFRPLTESFDMFYVSLIDEEFRLSYANITEMYDNSEFWYKMLGTSVLSPKYTRCLQMLVVLRINSTIIMRKGKISKNYYQSLYTHPLTQPSPLISLPGLMETWTRH